MSKPVYYHSRYRHGITVTGSHCNHLREGDTAYRSIMQVVDGKAETHYLCTACNEALCQEIYYSTLTCNDCGKKMPYQDAVGWSPYDTNPHEPKFYLCAECACGTKHLNRVELDHQSFVSPLTR